VLDALLGTLAIELHIKPDIAQAKLMEARWAKRNQAQVRQPARVSQALLDRCRPLIIAELAEQQGHMNGNGYKG
jgi:hypothetical protein